MLYASRVSDFTVEGQLVATARSRVHDTEGKVAARGHARLTRQASTLTLESLEVEVDLSELRTGDKLKDLEVRRRLGDRVGGRATLATAVPVAVSPGRTRVAGTLTFRGIARSLSVDAEITDGPGPEVRGRASFQVRFTDHGLEPPKVLFLKIDDAVDLQIDLVARRRSSRAPG